jgi:hypothetical protein
MQNNPQLDQNTLKTTLKKDLEEFTSDWLNLLYRNELSHDKSFLEKMSKDIQKLDEDALLTESDFETSHLIHHALATPWGAPFVCEKSLLEAAMKFDPTDEENDLEEIANDFSKFSNSENNEVITIFQGLEEVLLKEKEE